MACAVVFAECKRVKTRIESVPFYGGGSPEKERRERIIKKLKLYINSRFKKAERAR